MVRDHIFFQIVWSITYFQKAFFILNKNCQYLIIDKMLSLTSCGPVTKLPLPKASSLSLILVKELDSARHN